MFRSYRIGTLFGFPIEVNLTFLLMLLVVLLWFGGLMGLFVVLLAFTSVLLHELGHSLIARHLGVPIIGIELHFFGGAAKMGAQPKSPGDEIAIAAAGPAVSFALGGIGLSIAAVSGWSFFAMLGWMNVIIGMFNLIPALPMDGGRILRALLARRRGFRPGTDLAVLISRGFAIAFAVIGLLALHVPLVILAVVLWMMATAEQQMAARSAYGMGQPGHVYRVPQSSYGLHRPVLSGGFVVRAKDGRLIVELVD